MLRELFIKIQTNCKDYSNDELKEIEKFLKDEIIIKNQNGDFELNSKYKVAIVNIGKNLVILEDLVSELKNIKILLKNEKDTDKIIILKSKILKLEKIVEDLKEAQKNAQSSYDKIFSSMFNLDQKNPNTRHEDSMSTEELIKMFNEIQLKIEVTEKRLKDELSDAIERHFRAVEV